MEGTSQDSPLMAQEKIDRKKVYKNSVWGERRVKNWDANIPLLHFCSSE